MTSRPFTIPLVASVLLHLAGLIFAARLVGLSGQMPPMELIPIQVVITEPTPAPLLQPQPERPKPPVPKRITPPRLISKPSPPAIQSPTEPPPLPQELPPSLPSPSPTQAEEPRPAPVIPLPATEMKDPPGNVIGPAMQAQVVTSSGSAEGGEAGVGRLFANSDMAVLPGAGAGAGSGGPGISGLGLGMIDTGTKVTGLQLGAAKLRGGYQIKPRYPESARRQGIQGTSLLRLHVLADGAVGEILVERSAGHPDLNRAAVEAVKKWRFEPARSGGQSVAVWVMLPVRFELR